ncbi:MAG: M81 family metallopeptidase [Haliea sp.]|uniref:M81 family metallopeptidase n=1 Tax=Haliea sp. TaxID=1932666 RepID=UPI0032EAAFD1
MHMFAAAFNTETNTFSPFPTGERHFRLCHREDFVADPDRVHGLGCLTTWQQLCLEQGHQLTLSLSAFAEPSGRVVRSVYEKLRDEILADLRSAEDVDVVLLDLHGAMAAEGYDDCEGDLISRIRQCVGPAVVIAVELDLHCHFSAAMLEHADLMICYKEYPHIDINDRAVELFNLAVRTRAREIRPTMALFDCKMIGMYPTSGGPMHDFVQRMVDHEAQEGVLSVSLGHGFPWGDVADAGSQLLVVTDDAAELAAELARELGLAFFALRGTVEFASLPLEEAMSKALASPHRPVVVADQADNPGGGAPSDSTHALRWLLAHKVAPAAVAVLYDPEVVKLAMTAGEGARLRVRLGGKMSAESGDPLDLTTVVVALAGNHQHCFPQRQGEDYVFSLGDTAVLRCEGIDIVVSSERGQCFSPCILSDFGLNPLRYKVIVPKSTQHFHGAFAPIAAEIIYMAAPGAIAPIMQQIPFVRVDTADKYPWNDSPHGPLG